MSIFLLKDVSLRGRLILALVVIVLAGAVSLCSSWEKEQYRKGKRHTDTPPAAVSK